MISCLKNCVADDMVNLISEYSSNRDEDSYYLILGILGDFYYVIGEHNFRKAAMVDYIRYRYDPFCPRKENENKKEFDEWRVPYVKWVLKEAKETFKGKSTNKIIEFMLSLGDEVKSLHLKQWIDVVIIRGSDINIQQHTQRWTKSGNWYIDYLYTLERISKEND